VKTSCTKDLAPYSADWLYIRGASIAYQIYMRRSVGITSLRSHYGAQGRNGFAPSHHRKAGQKVIRHCLQQLGKLDLVGIVTIEDGDTQTTRGREVTKKGIESMDRIASMIKKQASQ